jgi:tRNA G18 (ribose-2'-O)-methylase SpoU
LPKSKGALAMTNQPQRAAVVANNISFLMREHRSHQEEWLRNHDRSVQEAAELNKNNMQRRPKIAIVLDDVRSAHNVGNILRAAEASGCEHVVLGGSMTPSPPNPKVLKTALGAAEYVRYQTAISTLQAVRNLKADGYRIFGIETTSKSNLLWQVSFFPDQTDALSDEKEEMIGKVALIFGNELVGVDIQVLEECDELVSVPTHGIKNSLNVATCASIIIWEALRQWEFIGTKTKEL